MIKAIVVAKNYSQFATFVRNNGKNRAEYGYFIWNNPEKAYGLDKRNVKVLWLEGWSDGTSSYNPDYIKNGVKFLKTFTNHSDISEVRVYGKNPFIRS